MYPWSNSLRKSAALREAKALRKRTKEEMAQELQELAVTSLGETTLDGVLLSPEDRLVKSHVARTLREATTPEGALEFNRVESLIHAAMGPGKSALEVLVACDARLKETVKTMDKLLRQGLRKENTPARITVLDKMNVELAAFAKLKPQIAADMERNVPAIKKQLQGEMEDTAFQKLVTLSSGEVKKECMTALDEMERRFLDLRKALEKGVDGRPGTVAMKARADAFLKNLKKTKQRGERAVRAGLLRKLEKFGNPQDLGEQLAKVLKNVWPRSCRR